MHQANVVIGMNFGDCGKGHITNYLSDSNTLNIRFNGGAQASHAVFLEDGKNHLFHHFGSGSLKGARTLLASHFIVNPLLFANELWSLSAKVSMREIFIDPRCRVTTPYDMGINDFNSFYHKKNDTCGVGINETVERSAYKQLRITAKDLIEKSDAEITSIFNVIEKEYVPFRLKNLELPLKEFDKFFSSSIQRDKIASSFLKVRQWMTDKLIVIWPDDNLIDKFLAKDKNRKLVFEGAQGMLLDQHRKEFMPFLTRSNTGIQNVLSLLQTVRTSLNLDVYLVTRTYLTRHGDGPLWNFNPDKLPFSGIKNTTNPENTSQGKMRYGFLNKKWYDSAILETETALKNAKVQSIKSSSVNVAMTCMDHVLSDVVFPTFRYSKDEKNNVVDGTLADFQKIKLMSYGNVETKIVQV